MLFDAYKCFMLLVLAAEAISFLYILYCSIGTWLGVCVIFFFSLSLLLLESSRVCNNCKVGPIVSLLCFSVIFFNCFSLLREFFPHSHYTYFKDSLTFVFLGSYQSVKLANKFESPSTNKLKNSTRVLFHNVGNSSQYLIYFGSAWL